MVLLKHHGNSGAVHEDNLPVACSFFEEGRFQPILLRGTGGVGDAAFIEVGNPSGVAANVDIGFGHVPLVALARSMLGLDEGHNAVSVESGTSIKNVKVRGNDRIELRNIVGESGSEYRAHCIYDLPLLGRSIHISSKERHNG